MFLDPVVEHEAQQSGGKCRDHDIAQQLQAIWVFPEQSGQDAQQSAPIKEDHRGDGSGLDDHKVGIGGDLGRERYPCLASAGGLIQRVAPFSSTWTVSSSSPSIRLGEDEMAGRGDRQKLGDPLDQAQDGRLGETQGCIGLDGLRRRSGASARARTKQPAGSALLWRSASCARSWLAELEPVSSRMRAMMGESPCQASLFHCRQISDSTVPFPL